MSSWQHWIGTPVYLNDRVQATLVGADHDGVVLDAPEREWLTLRPFDAVVLVRATPLSRWWAAVRSVDGRFALLGHPVRDDVDRRRHPRRPLKLPVSMWWPGATTDSTGLTMDVSVGGFSAVLDRFPPPGARLAVRLEGPRQPIVAAAHCVAAGTGRARFSFDDIGGMDVEALTAMTFVSDGDLPALRDGAGVLWSTAGSQPVTIRVTPLGCVLTGVRECPPRKEHVIVESQGLLRRARVMSSGVGAPRLGWLD